MLDVNREATTDMWVWIQSYTNILASGDSDSFDHLWYEIEISDCSQTFGPDWLPKRKSEQQPLPRGHLRLKSETLWRRCEIEIWHWVKAWNWVKGWGGGWRSDTKDRAGPEIWDWSRNTWSVIRDWVWYWNPRLNCQSLICDCNQRFKPESQIILEL